MDRHRLLRSNLLHTDKAAYAQGQLPPIAMPLVLMSYHICKALDDGPLQWRSRVQLYILSRFIRE